MRPTRELFRNRQSAYFVSTQTAQRQPFFRHERWAVLLRNTILQYSDKEYSLHAFVIMPDHLHLLILPENTIEKAVQMIKGGFSYRAKKELEWQAEIWQQGFTDHRIRDKADWQYHLEYIQRNPVKAGLVKDWQRQLYPYIEFPKPDFPQGLKPQGLCDSNVRAKARTLHSKAPRFDAEAPAVPAEANSAVDSRSNEVH
jgi:putative transposase